MTLSRDVDVDENDLSPDEYSDSNEESSEPDGDKSVIPNSTHDPSYITRSHSENSNINAYPQTNHQQADLPRRSLQTCSKLPNLSDLTSRVEHHEVQHHTSRQYSQRVGNLRFEQGSVPREPTPCISSSGADHQTWQRNTSFFSRTNPQTDPSLSINDAPINGTSVNAQSRELQPPHATCHRTQGMFYNANNIQRIGPKDNDDISAEEQRMKRKVPIIHPIALPTETTNKYIDDCAKNVEDDLEQERDSEDDHHDVLIPKTNEQNEFQKSNYDLAIKKNTNVSSWPSSVANINGQRNFDPGQANNQVINIGRTNIDEVTKRHSPLSERKPKSLKPEERISKRKRVPKMSLTLRNEQPFKASSSTNGLTNRRICHDLNFEFQQEQAPSEYKNQTSGTLPNTGPSPSRTHSLPHHSTIHSKSCADNKCQGLSDCFQTSHQNNSDRNRAPFIRSLSADKSNRNEERFVKRSKPSEEFQTRTTHVSAVIPTTGLNNVGSGNEVKPQPLRSQINGGLSTHGPSQPPRVAHVPSQYLCTQQLPFPTVYSTTNGSQAIPSSQLPTAFMNPPTLPHSSTNTLHLNGSEYMSLQNCNTIDTTLAKGSGKQVQPRNSIATNQILHQSLQQPQMIRSSQSIRTVNGVPIVINVGQQTQQTRQATAQAESNSGQRRGGWTEPRHESGYPHPHLRVQPQHVSGQDKQQVAYTHYLAPNSRIMNHHQTGISQGTATNPNIQYVQPSWPVPNLQKNTTSIQPSNGSNTMPQHVANALSNSRKCASLPQPGLHSTNYSHKSLPNNMLGNVRQATVTNGQRNISTNRMTNTQPVTAILPGQLPPCRAIIPHPLTRERAERAQFNRNLAAALHRHPQPSPAQPSSAFHGNYSKEPLERLEKAQAPFPKCLMLAVQLITYAAIEYRHYPFKPLCPQDHSAPLQYVLGRAREIMISATVCSQLIQIQRNGVALLEQQGFHAAITDEWLFSSSNSNGYPLLHQLWQKKVSFPLNETKDLRCILAVLLSIAKSIKVLYDQQDEAARNSLSVLEWLKQVGRSINDQLERGLRY